MLRERTNAGLESPRRQGRIGGLRPKLKPQQQAEIIKMVSRGRRTAADAARLFEVHPATVSCLVSARSRGTPIGGPACRVGKSFRPYNAKYDW
jgi:DNA invertase Pin-like site-specific DNA recombinase